MFTTILTGVLVFIIGQFILKLALEPIVSLKNVFGEISALFLREQAKITNANGTEEIQNELKHLSASILAHKQAVPFYKIFSFLLRLPNEEALLNACGILNLISYQIVESKNDTTSKIQDSMKRISEYLNITTEYGG
jgi:hypothetical protein